MVELHGSGSLGATEDFAAGNRMEKMTFGALGWSNDLKFGDAGGCPQVENAKTLGA